MEKLTEVKAVSCDRCGNTWLPRVRNPVKCPKCGHRLDSKISKKIAQNKRNETRRENKL